METVTLKFDNIDLPSDILSILLDALRIPSIFCKLAPKRTVIANITVTMNIDQNKRVRANLQKQTKLRQKPQFVESPSPFRKQTEEKALLDESKKERFNTHHDYILYRDKLSHKIEVNNMNKYQNDDPWFTEFALRDYFKVKEICRASKIPMVNMNRVLIASMMCKYDWLTKWIKKHGFDGYLLLLMHDYRNNVKERIVNGKKERVWTN
jgi:hypothetical protein